jgi:superfamily II DNA or RNA helicase
LKQRAAWISKWVAAHQPKPTERVTASFHIPTPDRVHKTEGKEVDVGLRDVPLERRYRTGAHDLVGDFYVPCLSQATTYRRAVGYFSSGALAQAAQGLNRLIDRGGRVQLIASPQLSVEDIEAMERGLIARSSVLELALLRQLSQISRQDQERRLEYVAWMIAEEMLDIRIAVMAPGRTGIFHEKIGLLLDDEGDVVAFSGSANETEAALLGNFESFHVYRSWAPVEREWVNDLLTDFESLWINRTPELEVYDLPEAVREKLLESAPRTWNRSRLPRDADEKNETEDGFLLGRIQMGDERPLREYQNEAIRNWFDAGGRGVLEMATGTGKTLTALKIASLLQGQLNETFSKPLIMLVVCPFNNLVRQWDQELRRMGATSIVASEGKGKWEADLRAMLEAFERGELQFLSIITSNGTLMSKAFQRILVKFPSTTLIIADEVHNLGARRLFTSLPDTPAYRLGLSATPERWLDPDGTTRIRDYFGDVVMRFTLQDALDGGYLCPYLYHPIVVTLDDDEHERYLELSERIAKLAMLNQNELSPDDSEGPLKTLLFKRARLVGGARRKIDALQKIMTPLRRDDRIIVYCSDASDLEEADGEHVRQIDDVVQKLSAPPLSMNVARYTYAESAAVRARRQTELENGLIQGLVAIRCLDEGVDIPAIKTAVIMASTTNPRQFIQRRGRVLRPSPGKGHATIFDMIVSPGEPSGLSETVFNLERRLFRKELVRVIEFASSAQNGTEVMHDLLPLREAWNCLDV